LAVTPREDLEQRAWRALVRTHSRVSRALDRELVEQTGLSLRAYQVIDRLARTEGGEMRMSELAYAVLLSASGMTRLADQLGARGLLERRQDRADARGHFAVLTEKGRALSLRAADIYQAAVRDHFGAHVTDAELYVVSQVLESFLSEAQSVVQPSRNGQSPATPSASTLEPHPSSERSARRRNPAPG
jgi:DNA-binding MarR family transcriptional regulator